MAITTLNNRSINRSDTAASGQLWTATSATASDFQAVSAGKIGQVLQTVVTGVTSTTSATYADIAGITVDITPAATSSKVYVLLDINILQSNQYFMQYQLMRDTTAIYIGDAAGSRRRCSGGPKSTDGPMNCASKYLDSPSSTSALTYKVQWCIQTAGTGWLNKSWADTNAATHPRCASSITVMEVLA